MTADRTQHVIDAIDGCLEDWTVSGDAMRWTPEPQPAVWVAPYGTPPPARMEGARPTLTVLDEVHLFPAEWISAAMENYASAVRAACEAAVEQPRQALNPTPEALAMRAQILRAFDLTPMEAVFEPDPKARALALRRQRNTGPARPTAAQAKRPRRHG